MGFSGPTITTSDGVETRYCCPFCLKKRGTPDVKFHLYYHSCGGSCMKCITAGKDLRGSFVCGRCGSKGVKNGGKTHYRRTQSVYDTMGILLDDGQTEESIEPDEIVPIFPLVSIGKTHAAYLYLKERNVKDWQIEFYQLKLGTGGLLNRIVIPNVSKEGKWTYWAARDYTGHSKLRYLCPPASQASRTTQVFGLAYIQGTSMSLVEGTFSAILAGTDVGALYGKKYTQHQLDLIKAAGITSVYCALDPDALLENIALAKRLYQMGMQSYIVQLPKGYDPADLGPEKFEEYKYRGIPYSFDAEYHLLRANNKYSRIHDVIEDIEEDEYGYVL